MPNRTPLRFALVTIGLGFCGGAMAQAQAYAAPDTDQTPPTVPETPPPASSATAQPTLVGSFVQDTKLYFSAPLHWDANAWAWFGGALVAIGASHHYDTQVRTHFTKGLTPGEVANINSDDLQDALPAVGILLGTWGYAAWTGDTNGHNETWAMFEAATHSSLTTYLLKFLLRREGPDQSSDPNEWFKSGGKSFPSEHAAASFAIGTVLAEGGGDDFRWLRRVLGYGLGIGTSYLRLKHNAHWLSDTVAGAAVGTATGQFALNHVYRNRESNFAVIPVQGGAMLTYRMELP